MIDKTKKIMKYLGKFATSGDVQTAIDEERLFKPYVAYVQDGDYIDWNTKEEQHDYSKDYLTFEIISAGTIVWGANGTDITKAIEYSVNSGITWRQITSATGASAPSFSVNAGDKVLFKGENSSYGKITSKIFYRASSFSGSTAIFNVNGNILSLTSATSLSTETFMYLFRATNVIDASNLVLPTITLTRCYYGMFQGCTSLTSAPALPATTLASSCYQSMFNDCTSLTSAPELLVTTLVTGCYNGMFSGCTNLNSVKALFTTTPSTTYTNNWLVNVSSTGTFFKNPSATWDQSITRGTSTVPANWTIQNAS